MTPQGHAYFEMLSCSTYKILINDNRIDNMFPYTKFSLVIYDSI